MRLHRGVLSAANLVVSFATALFVTVPIGVRAQGSSIDVPDTSLTRFYPTPLASQPYVHEDRAVWLAKVRGLLQDAPPMLRNDLVDAQSAEQFATTLALVERTQQTRIERHAVKLGAALQGPADGRVRTKALGGTDLTYRPITPCRIVDSRNATALPNPLLGNVAYNFKIYTATNFAAYGGSATNCGIPATVGIDAIAMVVSVLEEPAAGRPNFSAFLSIKDITTNILANVAVNFTQYRGISTMYVASAENADNMYMAMPAQLQANVVVDVVGYFIQSEATPISCVNTSPTSQVIANGAGAQVIAPACAAGYTLAATFCRLTTFTPDVHLLASGPDVGTGNARCSWLNQSGGSVTAETEARCCRVPGGSI